MSGELTKLSNIDLYEEVDHKVQVITNGNAPIKNVSVLNPAGFHSRPTGGGALLLFLYEDSSNIVGIPYQFSDDVPEDFEDNESGIYDLETATQYIKTNSDGIIINAKTLTINTEDLVINADNIVINASSVKIDRGDGLGPREVALRGDSTTDGAKII